MNLPIPPRRFPDCVPTLVDPASGVTLRAHGEADLAAIVEQSRDPGSQRWTSVPLPPGGYSLEHAREFALAVTPAGWVHGTAFGWAIEAVVGERRRFCGSIGFRLQENDTADVAFGLPGGPRELGAEHCPAVAGGLRVRRVRPRGAALAGPSRQLGLAAWSPRRPASASTARSAGCWCTEDSWSTPGTTCSPFVSWVPAVPD